MNGNWNDHSTPGEKATAKLECRVPESLKKEFVAICDANRIVPAILIRRLVEELVVEYRDSGPICLQHYREPLLLENGGDE